jgi:hypothetical protein
MADPNSLEIDPADAELAKLAKELAGGPLREDFLRARQAGAIDFSYTFTMAGQYLVICNFTPHFVNYAQSTFVLVAD